MFKCLLLLVLVNVSGQQIMKQQMVLLFQERRAHWRSLGVSMVCQRNDVIKRWRWNSKNVGIQTYARLQWKETLVAVAVAGMCLSSNMSIISTFLGRGVSHCARSRGCRGRQATL